MPDRLYTPEQADRTLPLVSRILEDVVRAHARWQEAVEALELRVAGLRSDRIDPEVAALEREALGLAQELEALERELDVLGVALKDRSVGLVDFPGEIDGRRVWLCWRLGEPAVRYWHELDAGFAGRQPLAVG